MDSMFRNKINIIPELALIIFGLCSSNYPVIFYGCLGIAVLNLILNAIAKKIAIKEIKNKIDSVSNQNDTNSDNDIIL